MLYPSLERLKKETKLVPGDVVETLGYYEAGDGGAAAYIIMAGEGDSAVQDEPTYPLGGGLSARLVKPKEVCYRMFGAIGDGKADDAGRIAAAHEYANRHGLPVVNLSGRFRLAEPETIVIQTTVQWGHTTFYIEESRNSKTAPRFLVSSSREAFDIPDAGWKSDLLMKLKPGTTIIPELAPFKNCLVVVRDENDLIGARFNYPKQIGWAKEEFFYVDEHGRIIGDLAWCFEDYTSLKAYPCDESYLVIEGGTFFVSGNSPGVNYEGYRWNGFHIKRSRTLVRNAWIGLEPGKSDTALDPRRGFYYFDHVFDITLENIKIIPWEQDRGVKETVVPAGTYGLGGARVLNGTFRNVTAEGSHVHWGVFGTNLMKNFKVENCRLNRVDVHFHCWNLHIRDSEIGYKGLSITGGGELLIENTKRYGDVFVNFRRDFGAKWDGNITIRNCRMSLPGKTEGCVLYHTPADFEYKYPVGFGRSVLIERLILDYTGAEDPGKPFWMMKIPAFAKNAEGRRLFFPHRLDVRDVSVCGRDAGVRIVDIRSAQDYRLDAKGGYSRDRPLPNCSMTFERVQLEEMKTPAPDEDAPVHLRICGDVESGWDEYSLYADVVIDRCGPVAVDLVGSRSSLAIRFCTIRGLHVSSPKAQNLKGSVLMEHCMLAASVDGTPIAPLWRLDTEQGTRFVGCRIHPPLSDGTPRPEQTDCYGFLSVNRRLRYTHVMTELSNDLESCYANKGEPITSAFRDMLKSRHESEPTELPILDIKA